METPKQLILQPVVRRARQIQRVRIDQCRRGIDEMRDIAQIDHNPHIDHMRVDRLCPLALIRTKLERI